MATDYKNDEISYLLDKISTSSENRAIIIIGKPGYGKFSAALELVEMFLKVHPLRNPDFICFRNDLFKIKTAFYLKENYKNLAWKWLELLHRRLNMAKILDENLVFPSSFNKQIFELRLSEALGSQKWPLEKKLESDLLIFSESLDKKRNIPIELIRQLIRFHTSLSQARVSLIGDFDQSDKITQNAALKLFEEPAKNHWLIITASDKKKILPTILSRCIPIYIDKPRLHHLQAISPLKDSISIMKEKLSGNSDKRSFLLIQFLSECIPLVEYGISVFEFCENLKKQGLCLEFLYELSAFFNHVLNRRHQYLRKISLPDHFQQKSEKMDLFLDASTAEIEEIMKKIDEVITYCCYPQIKEEFILPPLFLEIARLARKVKLSSYHTK